MYDINTGEIFHLAYKKLPFKSPAFESIRRLIYTYQEQREMDLSLEQARKLLPDLAPEDEFFKTVFWSRYKLPSGMDPVKDAVLDEKFLRYYYLKEELIVSPSDEEYPFILLLQVLLYENPFELNSFLEYQYQVCVEEGKDFFNFLHVALKIQENHKLFGTNDFNLNQELLQKWMDQNYHNDQKKAKEKNEAKGFFGLEKYQKVLVLYFYHKYHGIEPRTTSDIAPLARITHLLANKPPITKTANSDIYKMLSKVPNYKSDTRLLKDLEIVKELFERYDLPEIAKLVEDEIKLCKENQ